MVGKDCVAIAADRRFGQQAMTLTCDFQKIFPVNDTLMIGLAGLGTDVQTLYLLPCMFLLLTLPLRRSETFKFKTNMYRLKEEREIKPKTFAHLVSSTLYEKRYAIVNVRLMAALDRIMPSRALRDWTSTRTAALRPLFAPWT
jgi:20S proteasome subunit beta 3